jgi:DNA-binding NtrC family response regulator
VRELKNTLARVVVLSRGSVLSLADIPPKIVACAKKSNPTGTPAILMDLPEAGVKLSDLEMALIQKTVAQSGGNKSLAAQRLGISRKTLYEKLKRYGLE